ncbi:hypothetical protein P691DRAFT_657272 [Macrolepiota fuliginosa MF-IS2]|uniref:Uncharacterized protein n=1 Tax=Macrolepiota fuliginosa MF-IS2 TaxID=1400762 RepID=A0A9P5XP54_9AGAR|nr:hypothetical protein P691DRAFT_657272 [Macrolepiota fuliginosa MF-IS2]
MANLIATSKSGNDWTHVDLLKYCIKLTDLPFRTFFYPLSLTDLPPLPHAIEPFAIAPDHTQAPDDGTYKWIHYLDLAQDEPEGIAVDVFADRLMHLLGYDQGRRLILIRHPIPSVFCGIQYSLTTDVCICDENEIILLLVKDDETVHRAGGKGDAEPTLIASAIAAFQRNNNIRKELGFRPVEETMFPGIVFSGTFPTFYRIKVAAKLSQAIETGTYIDTVTEVYRHVPVVPGLQDAGMKDVENRHALLRYFIAFKGFLP